MSGIWAVLPIKRIDQAKQRMRLALNAVARRELAIAMFQDVLDALLISPQLAGIAVVTEDPFIDRYARRAGCRVLGDAGESGHTAAVMTAARLLSAERRSGMLALPGDIPLVTADEIAALLAAHRPEPSFTIAPSHDGEGSNGIVMSPPNAAALRFGEGSFRAHCDIAAAARLDLRVVSLPGFANDLDNGDDISRFMAIPSATRARLTLTKQVLHRGS